MNHYRVCRNRAQIRDWALITIHLADLMSLVHVTDKSIRPRVCLASSCHAVNMSSCWAVTLHQVSEQFKSRLLRRNLRNALQNNFCLLKCRSTATGIDTYVTRLFFPSLQPTQLSWQNTVVWAQCEKSTRMENFSWCLTVTGICKHSLYTGKCQASLQLSGLPPLHLI